MTPPQESLYAEQPKTKTCSSCKIKQPITVFGKQPSHKDGLTSQCRDCRRKAQIRRTENRQTIYIDENSIKICKNCKVQKPLTEFHKRKASTDGRHQVCKECRSDHGKIYYKTNRIEIRKRAKETISRNDKLLRQDEEKYLAKKEKTNKYQRESRKKHPERRKLKYQKFHQNNPDCHQRYYQNRLRKDPVGVKTTFYNRSFKLMGVDQEWYDKTLEAQGGVCLICRSSDSGVAGRRFCIDHDHSCCGSGKACDKCRRGLLCLRCNTWIERFEKFPQFARRALEYLNKYRMVNDDNIDNVIQYPLFSDLNA